MGVLHRMSDDQLVDVLAMLAQSGSTARSVDSWESDRMTALLLGERGNVSAAMPIAQRTIEVSPGRRVKVGWLSSNQFATRMGLRRQTRGSYPEWPSLLPELDALVVVRRDEASLSARWYAQTGFHDVLSVRCLYLDMTAAPSGGGGGNVGRYHPEVVSVGGKPGDWDAGRWQPEMLAVYRDVFGATGGAPLRDADFWARTLAHHYYREHYQFQVIGLWGNAGAGQTLMGYAVVGWSGWHSKRPRMDILELATRQWDTGVATELLQTTCQLAWSKNVHQVRAVISAHDPYRGHLIRSGFVDRWGYVMLAKWLHPQRYLDGLSANLPAEVGDLSLMLNTPGEVPLVLQPRTKSGVVVATHGDPLDALMQGQRHVASAHAALSLQGDSRTVTRLLLQRLDIGGALADGSLFSTGGKLEEGDVARLSLAFPWTPWVFHMVDYI
jgi:hypothetical protein